MTSTKRYVLEFYCAAMGMEPREVLRRYAKEYGIFISYLTNQNVVARISKYGDVCMDVLIEPPLDVLVDGEMVCDLDTMRTVFLKTQQALTYRPITGYYLN